MSELNYQVIYDMIRGGQCVANVYVTSSGKCVVSWPTSTVIYDSEEAARAVHIDHMGGRGEPTKFIAVWSDGPSFMRGWHDCGQDDMENAPFACIGGRECRGNPQIPGWRDLDGEDWLRGYIASAQAAYGSDWRTCEFSWGPALTVDDTDLLGGDDE